MKYRLTCLTPTLVGDGQKLAPIDYMVWKDHVNVLDQHRIFRLLAKGPRLEGYLSQLKKAEKLDFASWEDSRRTTPDAAFRSSIPDPRSSGRRRAPRISSSQPSAQDPAVPIFRAPR